MADVNASQGITGSSPLSPPQGPARTLRVTPSAPNPAQTPQRPDTISFSQAAQRLGQAKAAASAATGVYGQTAGLQPTTPAAAREALGAAARQMLAARVDRPMDYASGEVRGSGGMPFYANPAIANGVATSTSIARLGGSLDTNA